MHKCCKCLSRESNIAQDYWERKILFKYKSLAYSFNSVNYRKKNQIPFCARPEQFQYTGVETD